MMHIEEAVDHEKAIKAVARAIRRTEWASAAMYSALVDQAVRFECALDTAAARLEEQGYVECVAAWRRADRAEGLPLLSPLHRLFYARAIAPAATMVAPVVIARYVYYRPGAHGTFTKLFLMTGMRWRELLVRTSFITALQAQKVGTIQPLSGTNLGRKFTSVRLDLI